MNVPSRKRTIEAIYTAFLQGLVLVCAGCVAAGVSLVTVFAICMPRNLLVHTEGPTLLPYIPVSAAFAMVAGGVFVGAFSRWSRWILSLLVMPMLYATVALPLWRAVFGWVTPNVWEQFLPCSAVVLGIFISTIFGLPQRAGRALGCKQRSRGMRILEGLIILLGAAGVWSWRLIPAFYPIMSVMQMTAGIAFFLAIAMVLIRKDYM